MEKIKFRVDGNQIAVEARPVVITAGTVGLEAEFVFDSQWDTLSKILVFKAGEKVVATALAGNTHSIPWEVLEKPNQWLCVGVYGANGEGTVVIPTLWAKVSVIHTGTEPEGDPALEPSAPIWQEAVALAELGASAEQELRAAVDSLSEELQLSDGTRNLGDMFSELLTLDRYNEYMLDQHADNKENPHNVTCEQIGAVTEDALMGQVIDINVVMESVSEMAHNNAVDIAIHTNTDENPNPHEITCEKIGAVERVEYDELVNAYKAFIAEDFSQFSDKVSDLDAYTSLYLATKEELNTAIGDIETALDSILAIQNELIGGDGV